MTIIEYLSQYEKAEQEIRDVAKKRDHWIEMATSVGCSSLEPNYNSNRNTTAPYVKGIELADELNSKISGMLKDLFALSSEINDVIDLAKDTDGKQVLIYRYLCTKSWKDICEELDISEKTARRRHDKAIAEILEAKREFGEG